MRIVMGSEEDGYWFGGLKGANSKKEKAHAVLIIASSRAALLVHYAERVFRIYACGEYLQNAKFIQKSMTL